MEIKKRCGSNFDEEPISFEEFCETYNNFLYNFSGTHLVKPKKGNDLTEKEKEQRRFYYAEIAYRRKTGHHKEDRRNYYFLEKFNKRLADKIKREYRKYSDLKSSLIKDADHRQAILLLWRRQREELLKLGYEAYLLLREHSDDTDIQEAVQQRKRNGSDDYKAFFA